MKMQLNLEDRFADIANIQESPPVQEQPINPISTDDLDFFLYSNPNLTI